MDQEKKLEGIKPIKKILNVIEAIFWRAILWLTSFGK